jgi:hypothetical protein
MEKLEARIQVQISGLARQISSLNNSGHGTDASNLVADMKQDPETASELEQLLRTVRADGRNSENEKSRLPASVQAHALSSGSRGPKATWLGECNRRTPMCAPTAALRQAWGLWIPLLRCFVALVAPVHAAFGGTPALSAVLVVTDVFFLLDFFVRCRTSFVSHGLLVSDPLLLIKKHRASFIDALPVAWIGWAFADALTPRIFQQLRVLHALMPLTRGLHGAKTVNTRINPGVMRLGQLLLLLLLCAHYTGCLWWLVGTQYTGGPAIDEMVGVGWRPSAWLEEQGGATRYAHCFLWVSRRLELAPHPPVVTH